MGTIEIPRYVFLSRAPLPGQEIEGDDASISIDRSRNSGPKSQSSLFFPINLSSYTHSPVAQQSILKGEGKGYGLLYSCKRNWYFVS